MKLDFWQLSRDPPERVVALIAERVRSSGDRLLVVESDEAQRAALSDALWATTPEAFLANGMADAPYAERQPILIGPDCTATNGARLCVLADGVWRDEALAFERTFLLFGETRTPAARETWRRCNGREDVECSYFAQEDTGRWVKKL